MTAPPGTGRPAETQRRTGRASGWIETHPSPVDVAIALLYAAALVPMAISIIGDSGLGPAAQAFLYCALGVLHLCVAIRRARPEVAYVVGGIATCGLAWGPRISSAGLDVPAVYLPNTVVFFVLLYSIAAMRGRRIATLGLLIALAGAVMVVIQLFVATGSALYSSAVAVPLAIATLFIAVFGAWALGRLRRTRTAYVAELEAKNRRAEQDRKREAAEVVAAERARIARELHDVISHSLAVMISQAEGGRMGAKSRDPRSAEVFDTISTTGRTALSDMRSMVGLLRTADADTEQRRPQPGVSDIGTLVERARDAGLDITTHTTGTPRTLPAASGLAAYRLVQEAITNVVKHAGSAAHADVSLRWGADRLLIAVADDGAGARPGEHGVGLIGLRERLATVGGSIAIGERASGFELIGTIPYDITRASDPAGEETP